MKWPDKIIIKVNIAAVIKWAVRIWRWRRKRITDNNKDVL
jgi:hypothetical protein